MRIEKGDGGAGRMPSLYLALVHYPVRDKRGDTIASAITNLDLHDLSRTARTYGVKAVFVVTPLADQKKLAERIVAHWAEGAGSRYNPKRAEALRLIRVRENLAEAVEEIRSAEGCEPTTVATSAVGRKGCVGYSVCRKQMGETATPYLLLFGTAWGLAEDVFEAVDVTLTPIREGSDYNHLPVRSAVAITLDRLAGSRN